MTNTDRDKQVEEINRELESMPNPDITEPYGYRYDPKTNRMVPETKEGHARYMMKLERLKRTKKRIDRIADDPAFRLMVISGIALVIWYLCR